MSLFPANPPVFANCAYCRGIARIPPGRYYDGEPHCRQCALIREYQDNSEEFFEPYFAEIETFIEEFIDADRSVNPWA